MKKLNVLIWIFAAILVVTAAYVYYTKNANNYSPQTSQNQTSSASSTNTQNEFTNEKIIAPDFTLKDMDGNDVKLSDYKGKVVILNFWAVWCKYCKLEMPDLNELNNELLKNNEAVILTVDVQESVDTVKKYFSSDDIDLPVLFDSDGSVAEMYGISGYPTTFVIKGDGSIYTYIPHATDKANLLNILDRIKKNLPANQE